MASSSENSQPNGRIDTELIFKHISDLTNLLDEVQCSVSLFENPQASLSEKKNQLAFNVDIAKLHLSFIRETFEKLILFANNVCSKLNHLQTNVHDILGEIKEASHKSNPAEQIQTCLRKLTSGFINISVSLPSIQQENAVRSRHEQGVEVGEIFGHSSKSLSLDIPEENPAGAGHFSSQNFSHMIEALDTRTRQCLLCFSIFPVNTVINQRVLKNWWHGEDFLGSSFNEAENMADKILQELMAKCFIEAVREQCRLVGFQLRPSVHPLVIRYAVTSGFFSFGFNSNFTMELSAYSMAFLVKARGESSKNKLVNSMEADDGKLRTLFNISKAYPDLKPELFLRLKYLKVLCLGNWQNNNEHIELENMEFLRGLKNRRSLRLLSIRGISGVTELPESFCKQVNLRILDLKSCHNLQALPEDIGLLKRLTYLDMSGCFLLDWMPKSLASLTELHVLKGFLVVNSADSCTFRDLHGLTKLKKLSLYTNRHDFPKDDELSVFRKFEELQNLSIIWGWLSKPSEVKNMSTAQDKTAKNQGEGTMSSPVSQAGEVGGSNNTSDEKDDKRMYAGPAKLTNDRRLEDIPEKQDKNLVGLGYQRKTKKDEDIIEECNIASEMTMNQPNLGDGDGMVHGDNIAMDEGAAKIVDSGGATAGGVLKKESDASRNITVNSVGMETIKDIGDIASASAGKASKIIKPIFRKALTSKLSMKREKGEESKSREIFRSLKKLDIQCYPVETAPTWLKPENMKNLKKLYFRGGKIKHWSNIQGSEWGVEILRLRFLHDLSLEWGNFQASFPKLILVEKVVCPNINEFPKDQDGLLPIGKEDPIKNSTKD